MALLSPEQTMDALRADYESAECVLSAIGMARPLTEAERDAALILAIQHLYQRRVDRGEVEPLPA